MLNFFVKTRHSCQVKTMTGDVGMRHELQANALNG